MKIPTCAGPHQVQFRWPELRQAASARHFQAAIEGHRDVFSVSDEARRGGADKKPALGPPAASRDLSYVVPSLRLALVAVQ